MNCFQVSYLAVFLNQSPYQVKHILDMTEITTLHHSNEVQ